MTAQRVIRVSRVDAAPADFCLVSVSPDASLGSSPLDLKVVGTEGDNAFVATSKFCTSATTPTPLLSPLPVPRCWKLPF
jgi:hypothetical protein